MAIHRHNVGASRRQRKEEEGEDEDSRTAELDDDESLSEGSGISHHDEYADGEGSGDSDDEASASLPEDGINGHQVNSRLPKPAYQAERPHSASPGKRQLVAAMSDTDTMLNGLKISNDKSDIAEIHFGDMKGEQTGRTPSAPPGETRLETFAGRKRHGQEIYSKEKEENPVFVPTRGSFFLHDKRSIESVPNNHRPSKSRSRPYGLIVDGNVRKNPTKTDASHGPWRHDLHDTVAGDSSPVPKPSVTSTAVSSHLPKSVPVAPKSSPPNRSFSSDTRLGNVPAVVFLPGMQQPTHFAPISKFQYTRLPEHRPPLRRDKPVRISLPGQPPRYILPAVDRSFIFIPRALRPNQQSYRGRGRGGFFGARRPSFYANSNYSPSVALSRRSSVGKPPSQEGYPSPAGSVFSRQALMAANNNKPVVRLPPTHRPPGGIPPATGPDMTPPGVGPPSLPHPQPQPPAYRESCPVPIPMHQPRPQKAVSVADIETPTSFPFNPQPQHEPPFQHQVPAPSYGPDTSVPPAVTPVPQMSGRSIHAQPFQPYVYQQPHAFYPGGYPPGGIYYPGSGAEFPPYNTAVGPGTSVPPFTPGQHAPYVMTGAPTSAEQPSQGGTVAHEAGGTVYFYDASQIYPNNSYSVAGGTGPGGVVGMGGMMTPPGTAYPYYTYPQGSHYYPQ